ncbi:MAG TPA: Rieske 2Fe-2S domain-containing protein [Candidatus Acidoferrum sp.]|jgi:cytochrome b6-f complex iron-sulfur subunit|nr:Rieske 2Fe-2S domain-containing protein [Candidatus Acidoferrum sp.]
MGEGSENRIERIVSDLLRGKRLRLRGEDADEKEAITAAARLVAAGQGVQRMQPAFRKRMAQALEAAPSGGWLTRRAALVAGLGVATGVAAGGLVGRAMEPNPSPQIRSARVVTPSDGRWVDVGALADFTEGQARRVTAGAVGAFLSRRGETVSAVSSICSDLPCELQWNEGTQVLDCPCHPASFTSDGAPTYNAYSLPSLDLVSVRITAAGRVEVLGT